MRVFLTGATGFVGTQVVRELIGAGHEVLGLARSADAAAALTAAGARARSGSLEDLESLRDGAEACDAVIHLGFNPDFAKFKESSEVERRAIEAMGTVLAGSGKPLVVPNGLAGLATVAGRVITEDDDVPANYPFPRVSEQAASAFAARDVRVSVVRLPQVHDTGKQGLVTRLMQVARGRGVSAYVGEGRNRWPAAHVSDVARLFRLVLEAGGAGAKYHAVAEEGIELRAIAEAVGRLLGVPTRSLSAEEARGHFGPLAMFVAEDMPTSAQATRTKLRWTPTGPTLMADLERAGSTRR